MREDRRRQAKTGSDCSDNDEKQLDVQSEALKLLTTINHYNHYYLCREQSRCNSKDIFQLRSINLGSRSVPA